VTSDTTGQSIYESLEETSIIAFSEEKLDKNWHTYGMVSIAFVFDILDGHSIQGHCLNCRLTYYIFMFKSTYYFWHKGLSVNVT